MVLWAVWAVARWAVVLQLLPVVVAEERVVLAGLVLEAEEGWDKEVLCLEADEGTAEEEEGDQQDEV